MALVPMQYFTDNFNHLKQMKVFQIQVMLSSFYVLYFFQRSPWNQWNGNCLVCRDMNCSALVCLLKAYSVWPVSGPFYYSSQRDFQLQLVASWMEERTFSGYCEFWLTNIFYYESFIVRTNDLSDEEKRFIRFAASYFLLMDDRFAIQRSCVDQLSGSLQRQRLSLLPHHKHKTPYYWTTITLRGAKPYQLQLHNHVESIRWLRPRRRRWGKQGVERMQQRNL